MRRPTSWIGHDVGGVCPFALPEDVKVYLDVSLRRFETVFPAAGSSNSAVEMTCDELERYASNFVEWVDVCKGWRPEEQAMIRFLHAADFHLDSAFGALPARQAAERRRESRELLFRLADYVNGHGIGLVLLAGDLFDSASPFRETGEQLSAALGRMEARVFIAPGNHDWYGPGSPWETVDWPENVHVFRENTLTAAEVPEWNLVIHGAAFTGPEQPESLLAGFAAPADGKVHIGLLHGELERAEDRYDPLRREEVAASGLAYLALGHVHKRTEPLTLGRTVCAWPGCPEGRGFDELGEKGFYEGTVSDDGPGLPDLCALCPAPV